MAAVAAAFAGKAVATSTISYIINKAFDYLKDNKKAGGFKSTKKRLEALVPQIQAVFDAVDAEQISDQGEALDAWLWQLRDAVEEAEDAVDELQYYKLEEEVKMRDNKRLKSAVKTLEDVAAGVERFLLILSKVDADKMKKVGLKNQRETSSLPYSMVLGREEERKIIILQDITREEINMVGLNSLHIELKEKLSSKTFLLVLDDVWNDERVDDWENLARPLRYGKRGSKILLTTRMKSVADLAARALQEECHFLRLSGLEEADLLVLLNRHAFFGVNPDDYRNLQQISKKMVNKLSGSPLAAKVLGGLLYNNMDSSTWNRILASEVYNIEQGKEGIMKVLRLSYQHLPTHLQACFRYCSLFHKDYEFKKKELVHLWMGSGLIQQFRDNMMPEGIGFEFLDTLTKKSFFDVKSRPRSSREIKCNLFNEYCEERYVIHDLLHDLACSVSVKECVRIDRNFSGMNLKTVRHLYMEIINPTVVKQVSQAKKLRTLIIKIQEEDWSAQELVIKVLSVSKSLRVLSLTTSSIYKLPNEVGGLVHLRYLSLIRVQQNKQHFSWFPQSVYKLYHLQVMKYDDPHLAVPVKGELDDLCNLVSLRHFLDRVKSEEAAEIMLDQKESISAVSLSWYPRDPLDLLNVSSDSSYTCEPSKAEHLLDKLQPHPNSCKLWIQGYPGSRSPYWLESPILINLTYLYISDCKVLQRLPPIGRLPSLQYLYIKSMKSVDLVDSSFYGGEKPYGLQSLKVLEIEDMPICTEWVGLEGENLFPRLETLVVRDCEELRQLPNVPISIRHVEIHRAGLRAIPLPPFSASSGTSSASVGLSLSKLLLYCCPYLETLWHGYSLYALEELSIQQCVSLSCLPEDSFRSLSILDDLEIAKCPNLTIREIRLPPTVRWLTLGLCGDAEPPLIGSLQGLKSLRRLFLDGCAMPLLPSEVFSGLTELITMVLNDCAMTVLPSAESFRRLKNLENLYIWDCKKLMSLNGIQWLNSLTYLEISSCSSLSQNWPNQSVEGADLSGCAIVLGELDIDHPSLLLKEPLQSITTVKKLRISGGPELTHLPEEWLLRNHQALEELVVSDASHLQRLPQEMARLTSLKSLQISQANMLQTLPDLPTSLSNLRIDNCHSELKKRCKNNVGCDWNKIAHICDVDIQ
ncbi:hypothetical protein EJB05_21599, partial [Eragrostis curvula]